jgi:hypothetical protein
VPALPVALGVTAAADPVSFARELTERLAAAGLLNRRALLDGRVTMRDVSARNRNLLVVERGGRSWFVKVQSAEALDRALVSHERLAAILELARLVTRPELPSPIPGALVFRAEPEAVDLWVHHLHEERFPARLGAEVGAALGALHRSTRVAASTIDPAAAPTVLSIHRPPLEALAELTAAGAHLVRLTQADPSVCAGLDALREGWRAAAFIHGDVRWPNLLVVRPAGAPAAAIRIVDWEAAGPGDPAWDVGSALAAYVSFWLFSIRVVSGMAAAADLSAAARFPLASMRPALEALWAAYARSAVMDPREAEPFRARVAAMAAARLIGAAYESAQSTTTLWPGAVLHLQVAANVLRDPATAAGRLFGMEPASP